MCAAVRHVEEREDRMIQDCEMHWFESLYFQYLIMKEKQTQPLREQQEQQRGEHEEEGRLI